MKTTKALCLLNDYPELETLVHDLTELNKETEERMKFLKKGLETLQKSHNDKKEKIWDEIYVSLKENNLYPKDHDHKNDGFFFEHGVLFEEKNTSHGFSLQDFFGRFL